jgi:hypothetical protein
MFHKGSVGMLAALALAGSAVAGTMSGCSETDELSDKLTKAQYLLEMRALADEVREQTRLAIELVNVGSLKEAAPVIEKAVAEFDQIVARLEEIEPPAAIASLHNQLTAALGSASNLLTDAEQAVRNNNIASLIVLAPQLSEFRDRFRGIVADYDAQGYELSENDPNP